MIFITYIITYVSIKYKTEAMKIRTGIYKKACGKTLRHLPLTEVRGLKEAGQESL